MVAHVFDYTKKLVHIKWLNCVVYESYLNKIVTIF